MFYHVHRGHYLLNIGVEILLPTEAGIFYNVQREDRICKLCNRNQMGDELHFILHCKSLSEKEKDS